MGFEQEAAVRLSSRPRWKVSNWTRLRLSDVRIEILTIGSVGDVVFTERLDSMLLRGKPIASHIAGVYEVDAEGKIAAWRDHLDTGELSVQLGLA